MAEFVYDDAARLVAAGDDGKGVVMFKGWLGPPDPHNDIDGARGKSVRSFIDPQYLDWLEIRRADILHQAKAAADDPEQGSVIWVKREARIRRCQAGRAHWFKQLMAETADDPTARHPHPPW